MLGQNKMVARKHRALLFRLMSLLYYPFFHRGYLLVAGVLCTLALSGLVYSHERDGPRLLCLDDFEGRASCVNNADVGEYKLMYFVLFVQATLYLSVWLAHQFIEINFTKDGRIASYKVLFVILKWDKLECTDLVADTMEVIASIEVLNVFFSGMVYYVLWASLGLRFVDIDTAWDNGLFPNNCCNGTVTSYKRDRLACFDFVHDGMLYKYLYQALVVLFLALLCVNFSNLLIANYYLPLFRMHFFFDTKLRNGKPLDVRRKALKVLWAARRRQMNRLNAIIFELENSPSDS